jgi:catechol-2,3-dioxygenase
MSPYYRDPDGNGAELSIDNVEKAQWHEKMRKRRLRVAASRPF